MTSPKLFANGKDHEVGPGQVGETRDLRSDQIHMVEKSRGVAAGYKEREGTFHLLIKERFPNIMTEFR